MYNPTRPLQLGGGTIKKDFMPRIQDCKGLGHNAKVAMDEWQFHMAQNGCKQRMIAYGTLGWRRSGIVFHIVKVIGVVQASYLKS